MRLPGAIVLGSLLVSQMSGADIDRALAVARARDDERQQFHHRYIIELSDPIVTQLEITTEFRRLVMVGEEHVFRGDWMFTRSQRAAEEALGSTRGLVSLKAQVRFNPLNTYVASPPYKLALDGAELDTTLTPQFSVPFKTRDGRTLTSLIGAGLEAIVGADRIGQRVRTIGVVLQGQEVAKAQVDFSRLD